MVVLVPPKNIYDINLVQKSNKITSVSIAEYQLSATKDIIFKQSETTLYYAGLVKSPRFSSDNAFYFEAKIEFGYCDFVSTADSNIDYNRVKVDIKTTFTDNRDPIDIFNLSRGDTTLSKDAVFEPKSKDEAYNQFLKILSNSRISVTEKSEKSVNIRIGYPRSLTIYKRSNYGTIINEEKIEVTITPTSYIDFLEVEAETVKNFGQGDSKFNVSSNHLFQPENRYNNELYSQYFAQQIIDEYNKDKEIITLSVIVGDYFDIDGNLAVSPQNSQKMIVEEGDVIIPLKKNIENNLLMPFGYLESGFPQPFIISSCKLIFDGSILIELVGREFNHNYLISAKEKYAFSETKLTREHFLHKWDGLSNSIQISGINEIGANTFEGLGISAIKSDTEITSIGDYAFNNCRALIYLDTGYPTSIGEYAFQNCINFIGFGRAESNAALNLNDVTSLGEGAFQNCENIRAVSVNRLTIIPEHTFENCISIQTFNGGNYVTDIGDMAFANCINLNAIPNFPRLVTINQGAFLNCENITKVNIGDNVNYIGEGAFAGCSSLEEVHITNIYSWLNIDFKDRDSNPLIWARTLYVNEQILDNIIIPTDITEIKPFCFVYCHNLKQVDLGEVTQIGMQSFADCWYLAEVTAKNVTTIDYGAFSGCDELSLLELKVVESGKQWNLYDEDGNRKKSFTSDRNWAEVMKEYSDCKWVYEKIS